MTTTINASNSGSGGLVQTADASGVLALQTAGTTAVTIDASQNVGIGTASPARRLHVKAAGVTTLANSNGALFTDASNAGVLLGSDNILGYISGVTVAGTATVDLVLQPFGGNVLVGTTSSSGKLTVSDSTAETKVAINNTGTGGLNWWIGSTNNSSGAVGGGKLAFYDQTNNAARMVIDGSGNVLVGTTSTSVTNGGFNFLINDGGTGYSTGYVGHITGTPSGYAYLNFKYAGTAIGTITQNGTTGVLYNLTSDYRLKDNPVALTGAKDFVMALQPKTWDWWDGSGKGVGFIAHEFMEVAKYSGHGEKDAVDSDNKPVYQSIQPSSSEVMANLVAFVQEQQALIISLTARIAALEGTPA
jgi:hypothetical protein